MRRAAWNAVQSLPTPGSSDEEWRRTDIRLFRLDRFHPPTEAPSASASLPDALLRHGVELGGYTTTLDSHSLQTHLEPSVASRGVLFGSLEQFVTSHGERLRPRLMTEAFNPSYDRFAALHAAFWSGGAVLYVPRGVTIEQPLHVFNAMSDQGVDFSHTLIVLEEGAEATVLAETAGGNDSALHCGAIEILLGPGARLRYVNLQNWGTGTWHFAHQKAICHERSALQWTIGALGSRLAKVNQHCALVGPQCDAQVNGVMFTEGKQHLSYNTLQLHQAENCKSDLLYKGALQDHSRVVWRGMIKVDPVAQKTNAYQRNDNLMLSEGARADSIPGLEIEADDVRCTHGATAGRVDDEMIFYARTRGLTRNEAVRMIVAGFFQQVFDRITIESVRDALAEAIGRRIREYD